MSIIFPKEDECRIKEDPILWLKNVTIKIHGFEGKKKYFWHTASFFKAIILYCRTVYAYQNMHDPRKVAELAATYPVRFMAVWKMFYLYFHRKQVSYFCEAVSEFWDIDVAGPKLHVQLRKRFFYINFICKNHVSASFICLALLMLFPLVDMPDGVRKLPNIIWTPFDTNPSPLHEFIYVFLTWNLFLSIMGNWFYDAFYVYCIQHLIVQFILLKELLRNITSGIMDDCSDVERFNSKYFQDKVMERLSICIKHHCKLIKFGKNLEIFCSIVLVPQLIMSYAVFVINGYILTVDHSEFSKTVLLFNLTGACFIQLALYAIQASDLRDQSLSVIDAIIHSDWYLFKSPIKRALTFIMLNTEKGLVIRAGGMIDVDKPILIEIIQKAFSAITLMKALIDETAAKN